MLAIITTRIINVKIVKYTKCLQLFSRLLFLVFSVTTGTFKGKFWTYSCKNAKAKSNYKINIQRKAVPA